MTDLITRLQDWYISNCDGDWEHDYGIQLQTLDNPGWLVRIDLTGTEKEDLIINKEYQNEAIEDDWYYIVTKGKTLELACGPSNLAFVLKFFLDDIVGNHQE